MNTKSNSFSSLGTSGFCRGTASSHASRRPDAGAEGRLLGGEGHRRIGRCGRGQRIHPVDTKEEVIGCKSFKHLLLSKALVSKHKEPLINFYKRVFLSANMKLMSVRSAHVVILVTFCGGLF